MNDKFAQIKVIFRSKANKRRDKVPILMEVMMKGTKTEGKNLAGTAKKHC